MKILFSSDFHSNPEACRRFVTVLDRHDFALGVLGGDITEGFIPEKTLIAMFAGINEDAVFPKSRGSDHHVYELEHTPGRDWYSHNSLLLQGLRLEEQRLKTILTATGKPVLFIPGNHDRTAWKSHKNLINIHGQSIEIGGYNFVGYRYCGLEKIELEISKELRELEGLITENTIFVSHAPPYNILDRTYSGTLIGSRAIASAVRERKPRFHLFGHVHESWGVRGNAINGSYVLCERFYSIDLEENKVRIVNLAPPAGS